MKAKALTAVAAALLPLSYWRGGLEAAALAMVALLLLALPVRKSKRRKFLVRVLA